MLSWFNFSAILPLIKADWNLTGSTAGLVIAGPMIGYVISVLFTGFLADRVGGAKVFAIFALFTGLASTAFTYYARDFYSALFLRAIMGLGIGGLYVPGIKILTLWYPSQAHGRAIGLFTGSMVASQSSSYLVAGLVAANLGWQSGFLLTSVWAFPAAFLAFSFVKDRKRSMFDGATGTSLAELLRSPAVWMMNFSYVGHCWELYPMRGWIGPFLYASARISGHPAAEALALSGVIGAASIFVGAFSPWLGGWMSDRVGRTKTIMAIMGLSIPCSLIYGWLIRFPVSALAVIGVFYGFWIMAETAVFKAGLAELVSEKRLGTALGIQSFLGFGATSISTALFGLVLDLTNDPVQVKQLGYFSVWGWAFTMVGAVAAIGPLCAYALMRNPASRRMAGGKR